MKRLLIVALLLTAFSTSAYSATDTVYVKAEKSKVVAVVLSLIFPGAGNYYTGNNVKGSVFMTLGLIGYAAIIKGALEEEREYNTYIYSYATASGNSAAWIGAGSAVLLGSCVGSAITAGLDCRPKTSNTKISPVSIAF